MRERISADFDFLFSITPPFEAAIGFGPENIACNQTTTPRIRGMSRTLRPPFRARRACEFASCVFPLPPFMDPSSCPGRGQARLARAGEGSSHIYLALNTLRESWLRSETSLPQSEGAGC